MTLLIDCPFSTPLFSYPRENPLVSWAIILVPTQCITCNMHLCFDSSHFILTTWMHNPRDDEFTFKTATSTVELSVNMNTMVLLVPPLSPSSSIAPTTLVTSHQFDDSSSSSLALHVPILMLIPFPLALYITLPMTLPDASANLQTISLVFKNLDGTRTGTSSFIIDRIAIRPSCILSTGTTSHVGTNPLLYVYESIIVLSIHSYFASPML